MNIRTRKFVGTMIILPFVVVYTLLMMVLAVAVLPGTSGWLQLAFYVVTGLIWVVPTGYVVRWMSRPDPGALQAPFRGRQKRGPVQQHIEPGEHVVIPDPNSCLTKQDSHPIPR